MICAGYDGTVDEVQFAKMSRFQGAINAVGGRDDLKPIAVASPDRTVSFAPGTAFSHGVLVESDTVVNIQLDSVASGSRWDTVVLRRDWQPTVGTAQIMAIPGTATKVLAAGVLNEPGVRADQPVALCRVASGQSLVQEIVDLRAWPAKLVTSGSLLGLGTPALGTEVYLTTDKTRYRYQLDTSGNAAWVRLGQPQVVTSGFLTAGAGWNVSAPIVNKYLLDSDGFQVQYDLQARKSSSAIRFAAGGELTDSLVATSSGPRPQSSIPVHFRVIGGSAATSLNGLPASGYMLTDGRIYLEAGIPNSYIPVRAGAGDISLQAIITFTRES